MVVAGLLSNLGQIKLELLLQFFYIDWPGSIKQPGSVFFYISPKHMNPVKSAATQQCTCLL